MRKPDEIITELSAVVETPEEFAFLRELMWDVIEDVIDSVRVAMECPDDPDAGSPTFVEPQRRAHILATVTDYVTNNYGDD